MYHFIFINEASIENEKTNAASKENVSEKDKAQTEQKDKSNQKTDAGLYRKWNQPNDIHIFINKN